MGGPPADPLPEGTLTLLFSDVEGSTGLLARLGERYADVVSLQRSIQREAFARHGGHELGTEGDSFFVVFRTAAAALAAALDAQRGLVAARWPGGDAVRVRMGLHTGEPRRHEDGYVGMDVHRAARVAAVAHGGQVLVSDATRALVAPAEGVGFRDLGEHRLKDLPAPVRLHQLLADGLPAEFPPPRSLGSGATVPQPATSLVGRGADVARLTALLREAPVVTVTGPGGVGKTRVATAVAAALQGRFPDGVYFVPLAPVRETGVMWSTLAETLGVAGERREPADLLDQLRPRSVLLVLDNLEQLPGAAGVVDEVSRAGPGVRVLATSRRPLHLQGEHEHPLAPLDVPPPGSGPAAAAASSAVELFVARARLVRPGLALDEGNVADVVAICRQLDGLPLALELVAARSKLLGPRALRARLGESLELGGAAIGIPDRQRTLRSAIAWSVELLPPGLRAAQRALSVLDGEFDLNAAAAVVGDGADPLDVVAALVDASLVMVREGEDGEPRFRMLRTVASFGRAELAAAGEADDVRRRHARHFLALAAAEAPRLGSAAHLAARDRLVAALDNLRAALEWSLGGGGAPAADPRTGLALCQHLSWFWYACGYQREGRRWLSAAVEAASDASGAGAPGAPAAPAAPEVPAAPDAPDEADPPGAPDDDLVGALHGLGVLLLQHGDAERARVMLTRTLEHHRGRGHVSAAASALNSLGVALRELGEPAAAREHLEEAVALARDAGSDDHLANALSNLAALEIDAGGYDRALALLRESLELDRRRGDAWGMAAGHVNVATTLLRSGRPEEAGDILARHGPDVVALGDDELTVEVVEIGCALAALRGETELTARLRGASSALRTRAELAWNPGDQAFLESRVEPVRRAADPGAWARAEARGAAEPLDAARAAVAAGDQRPGGGAGTGGTIRTSWTAPPPPGAVRSAGAPGATPLRPRDTR